MYSGELSAHFVMSTLVTASPNQVNTIVNTCNMAPVRREFLSIGRSLEQCGSFTFRDLLKTIFAFSELLKTTSHLAIQENEYSRCYKVLLRNWQM